MAASSSAGGAGVAIWTMADPETLLFAAGFPPATREDWLKLVDSARKGAAAKLSRASYDGLPIEPLYARAASATAVSGRPQGATWTLMQRVDHPDPATANAQALEDLENGATGLLLVCAGAVSAYGFGLEASPATLARVLERLPLDAAATIDVDLSPPARHVVSDLADVLTSCGLEPAATALHTGFDPIGDFAVSGRNLRSWSEIATDMAAVIGKFVSDGFRGPFVVADGRVIHNAGGSEAQELAFALASALAYLRALETGGMTLDAAREAIYFRLSADAEQFLTMAKFRAIRKLWARIEAACGLSPKPTTVAAETAWRMMTRRDPYVNMLRTTVAVAAAGLGGADSIVALPYTAALGLADSFARRVARNSQLILLTESNLARVADPGAGSGALEAMTQGLCSAAWSSFQAIETAGGIWSALRAGTIQQNVAAVRLERQQALAYRNDILTGTNAFPNIHEIAPATLDVAPVTAPNAGNVDRSAAALPRIRLAEPFELLRDTSDRILAETGARPKIFLANLGTLAEFTARASFAKNFFETGGIEATSSEDAVADTEAVASAFKASGAVLACLCASDRVYERGVEAAAAALKTANAKHVYLAGRPGEREAILKSAGVQSFVYEGCDALATLKAAYDILNS
jgi:methylmalonyl-CoA mutase